MKLFDVAKKIFVKETIMGLYADGVEFDTIYKFKIDDKLEFRRLDSTGLPPYHLGFIRIADGSNALCVIDSKGVAVSRLVSNEI